MDTINQKSLVVLKPDALKRNLIGEIISRFERAQLKITKAKMMTVSEELVAEHYPVTDVWLEKVGGNTLADCQKYGFDPMDVFGTTDAKKAGKIIHEMNQKYLTSGPVLAMVIEGTHAIEVIRKLVGATIPTLASPGTIRGDFCSGSAMSANLEKVSINNLVHASGDPEEAEREIKLWFGE